MKKVAVIMGSDSDLPVLKGAFEQLKKLGIPFEAHVYSAHRTPAEAAAFAASARESGFGVLIAAAGKAAHLAGALAASLGAMAANVTAANPRYADRTGALSAMAAACDAQRTALLALIEADAAGFLPLQRAYAIPKTDLERAARLADAARTACQAPLDMLAHCAQIVMLLDAARDIISPLLRSDIGCAAALCRAAAGKSARAMRKTEYSPDKRLNILRFPA